MRNHSLLGIALIAAVSMSLGIGCGPSKPEPRVASSASEPSYAASYPTVLDDTIKRFGDAETETKRIDGAMSGYVGELQDPPWKAVEQVYRSAFDAGRAQVYNDGLRDVNATKKYVAEEGDDLTKKVAGSAQYVVQKKPCDVDVTGPVSHALKEGFEKSLEKRLHARNEAHAYIERYREALGKKNGPALEKQADEIALASYLAFYEMPEMKDRLQRMLDEADQVKKTLETGLADERAYQSEAGHSDAEKKSSHARVEAMQRAQQSMEASINKAKPLIEQWQQRIEQTQKQHTDSAQAMIATVQSRKGSK